MNYVNPSPNAEPRCLLGLNLSPDAPKQRPAGEAPLAALHELLQAAAVTATSEESRLRLTSLLKLSSPLNEQIPPNTPLSDLILLLRKTVCKFFLLQFCRGVTLESKLSNPQLEVGDRTFFKTIKRIRPIQPWWLATGKIHPF